MANDDIRGTITDEAGNAIEGAVVALIPDEGDSGDNVSYTTTDANGDFLFDSHLQGDWTTQEWHVVAHYEDGGGSYNTVSKPNIAASLPASISRGLLYDFNPASLSLSDGDSVSSWTDDESGETLSAVGSPTYRASAINGKPVVEVDGVDDGFTSGITDSQPVVWYFVIDQISQSVDFTRIFSDTDDDFYIQARPDGDDMAYQFGGSNPITGSTYQTGTQLLTLEADDANSASRLRRDASDIITGDGAGGGYADLGFGYRQNGDDEYWSGQYARILGYNKSQMRAGQIADVESALNDQYALY